MESKKLALPSNSTTMNQHQAQLEEIPNRSISRTYSTSRIQLIPPLTTNRKQIIDDKLN
jgi:hypothetical protein